MTFILNFILKLFQKKYPSTNFKIQKMKNINFKILFYLKKGPNLKKEEIIDCKNVKKIFQQIKKKNL